MVVPLFAATIFLSAFLLFQLQPILGRFILPWFSRRYPDRASYRLYALSNAGSLLALVSYPFAVEPALPLTAQAGIWSWTCAIFALLCGSCAAFVYLSAKGETSFFKAIRRSGS